MFADLITEADLTLSKVLGAAVVGIIIATVIIVINKNLIGGLVKALLRDKIDTPEKAKTLPELGFGKKGMLAYCLRDGSTLRNTVSLEVGEDGEKRYYITDEKSYRASSLYNRRGASPFAVVLAAVLATVLGIALLTVVPDLIQMATNLINKIKG